MDVKTFLLVLDRLRRSHVDCFIVFYVFFSIVKRVLSKLTSNEPSANIQKLEGLREVQLLQRRPPQELHQPPLKARRQEDRRDLSESTPSGVKNSKSERSRSQERRRHRHAPDHRTSRRQSNRKRARSSDSEDREDRRCRRRRN